MAARSADLPRRWNSDCAQRARSPGLSGLHSTILSAAVSLSPVALSEGTSAARTAVGDGASAYSFTSFA